MTAPLRILAITTMRNEGPFVLDWVAHTRAIGVTDILVYSNECDDGTEALLDRLAEGGALLHERQSGGGKSVQWRALRSARAHPVYETADWVTCIDCDEFIVPKAPFEGVADLIAAADADALVLPWRLFGSSGHLTFEDAPVPDRFTMAAPEEVVFPAAARFFKTLWRRAAFRQSGVHRPKSRPSRPARWIDGSGTPLPTEFAGRDAQILLPDPRIACGRVQLNHYSVRSAEDFLVKRRRGLPNRASKPLDATYWAERNFNTVEETSIAPLADGRRRERARLAALPGVAAAHEAAVARHQESIDSLLSDPDEARLFTRLALLPDSVLPDAETSRALARLMARAAMRDPQG